MSFSPDTGRNGRQANHCATDQFRVSPIQSLTRRLFAESVFGGSRRSNVDRTAVFISIRPQDGFEEGVASSEPGDVIFGLDLAVFISIRPALLSLASGPD